MKNFTKLYKNLQNFTIKFLITILIFSCQEVSENPDLISNVEDLNTKILPSKLDLTGRVSFLNLNSFTDFVEKYHDREDLDIFKDKFVSLRQRNEELANSNPSLLRIEDDDIEEDYIVTDDFTASIVNEDREIND